MIFRSVDQSGKGWFTGPWDSAAPVAVGSSDVGVGEVHSHGEMYEIYLVARGTSTAVVDGVERSLSEGDMLLIEPGETHTLRDSSDEYLHFVVQTPFVPGDKSLTNS